MMKEKFLCSTLEELTGNKADEDNSEKEVNLSDEEEVFEEKGRKYEENSWGQHVESEGPDGFTFKSKKRDFEEIVEVIQKKLKKGLVKVIKENKIQMKCSLCRGK